MPMISLFLDLSRGVVAATATFESLLIQGEADWRMHIGYADADGETAAHLMADRDSRCCSVRVGTGTGVAGWTEPLMNVESGLVAFLHPGDRLVPSALTTWLAAFARRPDRSWAVMGWEAQRYADWWFEPIMRESALALLLLGAVPPDCSVVVQAGEWKRVCREFPFAVDFQMRAAAYLMMAWHSMPILQETILAAPADMAPVLDAGRLAELIRLFAEIDAARLGRAVADVARIGSGLRVAREALLESVEGSLPYYGNPPSGIDTARWWGHRVRLDAALVARGQRSVWIWGAGGKGREALKWLRDRSVPVLGFLDSNPAKASVIVEQLPVRYGPTLVSQGGLAVDSPLIVIASMYFPEIAKLLESEGWHEGRSFAIFDVPPETKSA